MSETAEELDSHVAAAVRGDRGALARVLENVRPLVVRYCRARVGAGERGHASADDVAQEVCLAVMTALPRYQDQGRPFMAFVYGIAAHKVADAHRNTSRNKSDPVAEVPDVVAVDGGPEQRALDSEASREMNALLATLPEKHREILILRLVVGLSAEETAASVGSTAGAVRVAQHRAIAKLKKEVMRAGESSGRGRP
ncbi:sigma-70 family RNA polymerase sigma factor [Rhodococcus rhodnii]|uniref:RNA polymerase sigma factor SigD n=2 Tax=Rhodococcus rhodnii TaxID=38312 RepID=R7WJQ3_9NOCA|nr:sigma-70 family RNA polymerase sigma factor [Rhodococcus rhodnii]EOM75546.1 RNA polymerase sigma factor SigD [Rhodococcus rhodnii LMG 5362]TXG90455.1 sigma-70 family RNA polymerase sigma factor [Rhodococcus rhodnii]